MNQIGSPQIPKCLTCGIPQHLFYQHKCPICDYPAITDEQIPFLLWFNRAYWNYGINLNDPRQFERLLYEKYCLKNLLRVLVASTPVTLDLSSDDMPATMGRIARVYNTMP